MKIDAHHHFWKYSEEEYGWINEDMAVIKHDFLPEHLFPLLRVNGLVGTIAVEARSSLTETHWLLELADGCDFIKGVVGWVDLRSEKVDEQLQEFAAHPKMVGVRHVVQDEPDECFLLRKEFLQGIEKLAKYDLAYDVLIFERHLPITCEFVARFPEQRFVLDHIAKPRIKDNIIQPWCDNLLRLAAFPNVFCKVSGLVTEANWQNWEYEDLTPYLDVVFGAFGCNRIMFGSDWPVCTLAADYSLVRDVFMQYLTQRAFSEAEFAAMLGGNALRIYKIQ